MRPKITSLCLSAHGRLPGTLRYNNILVFLYLGVLNLPNGYFTGIKPLHKSQAGDKISIILMLKI